MELPFAPSCERNQQPICEALSQHLTRPGWVLEVASGTGQHGVYMATALPHLTWQCSDLEPVLDGLAARVSQARLANLPAPLALDISQQPWPPMAPDAVFTANLLHIASWDQVVGLFRGCSGLLKGGGPVIIYGPFNEDGFTSEGNARLDAWARESFPGGGLRELAAVAELATQEGFRAPLVERLPANNLLLILEKAA